MLDDLTLQMSMFAPIDFSKMRQTDLGISLLDDRMYASRLRNVSQQLCRFVNYRRRHLHIVCELVV